MDIYKLLSLFFFLIIMICAFRPGAFPKKYLGMSSDNSAIKSGRLGKEGVSSSPPFELFKNTKMKRARRVAGPNTEMECPQKRGSRSLDEMAKCPETFCQHVSYMCNMQCQGQDTGDVDCELYNCTGAHHCSSANEFIIPIEDVCDKIDQCPDSDDESTCASPCWPSCMCIGLSVNYRDTNMDISGFRFSIFHNMFIVTNQNDPQSVGVSHLSYLSYLVITDIHTLPERFIRGFHKLKSLDLSKNNITFLSDDDFRDVSSLVSLKLSSNMINRLSNNVFNGLSRLIDLDLSHNQIKDLPDNVLSGLSSLTKLDLSKNQIKNLPDNVLSGLSSLTQLDLSKNQIKDLPDNVFSGLSVLEYLYLSGNKITFLPENVFSGLSALKYLYLDGNKITFLPENVFSGLSALKYLSLDENKITFLPENVFSGLSALEYLSLDENKITFLPENVFSGLSALEYLSLNENKITFLPENVLSGLSALEYLSLDENKITFLPENVFSGLSALEYLSLDENKITFLPENVFSGLSALEYLYLDENKITFLPENVFSGLSALEYLYLDENKITFLPENVFSGLSALDILYLNGNKITFLPENVFDGLSALDILYLNGNKITFLPENVFSGLFSLSELYLGQNQIVVLPDDVFSRLPVILSILLNNNKLSALPSLPVSIEVLDISYNSFTNLHYGSFINNSNMSLLSVIGNDLEVNKYMFEGLKSLQTLLTDTPFMCCAKPKSVSNHKCIQTKVSNFRMLGNCFRKNTSCKSEVEAISSCDALIGSVIQRFCLWIIGICAIVGNIIVFFYRVFIERGNITNSYSLFVLNLCISDFLMGVYLLIIGVADVYYNDVYAWNDRNWRRSIVCTTAGILSTISSEMSTFLILLVTIDRVIVIAFPMSRLSRWSISWKQATIISVSLWFVSISLAIIPIVAVQSYFKGEYYSQSGVCLALPLTSDKQPGAEYSFALFVCLNCIIFIVIVIGQICIFKSIITSGGRMTSSQTRQRDVSVARTLFMVVATDFCCWFPIGVMGVLSKSGYSIPNDAYAWIMVFVLPVNAAINPFLYTATAVWRKRQREKRRAEMISPKRSHRHQAAGSEMETSKQ